MYYKRRGRLHCLAVKEMSDLIAVLVVVLLALQSYFACFAGFCRLLLHLLLHVHLYKETTVGRTASVAAHQNIGGRI